MSLDKIRIRSLLNSVEAIIPKTESLEFLTFFIADKNNHSDVVLWENDKFYLVGRTHSGEFPEGGDCKEPVISLDGSTIAFQSNAPNMVSDKGIADISIISAGFGYTSSATVQINDSKGFGALVVPILSTFGEVIGLRIDSPGQGYTDPSLAIISSSKPLKTASAKPLLVNKYGDIFRIEVDSLKRGSGDSLYGSIRVSENQSINGSRTGGDERSREPSIDMNGTRIVYSSLASNLLQNQISHSGQKTFANNTFRSPQAKAILHGGIGKFIISNPGTGYPSSGSFLIQDLSGNGSGAWVWYPNGVGTVNGVTSDFDGNFTVTGVEIGSTLTFSYIGYITQELVVKDKSNLSITLAEDVASGDINALLIPESQTAFAKIITRQQNLSK